MYARPDERRGVSGNALRRPVVPMRAPFAQTRRSATPTPLSPLPTRERVERVRRPYRPTSLEVKVRAGPYGTTIRAKRKDRALARSLPLSPRTKRLALLQRGLVVVQPPRVVVVVDR